MPASPGVRIVTRPVASQPRPASSRSSAASPAPGSGPGCGHPRPGLDKLVQVGVMAEMLLAEVRRAPLDQAGRRRLREAHEGQMLRACRLPDATPSGELGRRTWSAHVAPWGWSRHQIARHTGQRRRGASSAARGCRGHPSPTGCTRLARTARQWRLRSSSHSVGARPGASSTTRKTPGSLSTTASVPVSNITPHLPEPAS
jgi:hypothetical protein